MQKIRSCNSSKPCGSVKFDSLSCAVMAHARIFLADFWNVSKSLIYLINLTTLHFLCWLHFNPLMPGGNKKVTHT